MTRPQPTRRCWWHSFAWGEVFTVQMSRFIKDFITEEPTGESITFSEHRQRGMCQKCGFVKERRIHD